MEQNIIYNSDGIYNIIDIIKEKNDESTINKITITETCININESNIKQYIYVDESNNVYIIKNLPIY